ncbi:VP7 protein [Rotavirus A]|uniref:Outer capsid glycoprotein VP7 n=1 Tax=Rotavirus A TaxID=28875 RepID=A0A0N7KVF6_9REOV|nr:VP7 protein [Rotavirus A]
MYDTECISSIYERITRTILATLILYYCIKKVMASTVYFITIIAMLHVITYQSTVQAETSLDIDYTVVDTTIRPTSTLCIYYPSAAETEINDPEMKETVIQLLTTKGWDSGSVYMNTYTDLASYSKDPSLQCDYNIVLVQYAQNTELDISEIAQVLMFNWQCSPMDITLYYYQQISEANKWIAMGDDCTIKVCPLNKQTLGIGCVVTNDTTFETITQNEKMAILDVVDNVNHKISYTTTSCTMQNCIRKGLRENVAIIQVGGPEVIDSSSDPMTNPQMLRSSRINWKKWWQVFYTIVDYINTIINTMSSRSSSNSVIPR